MIDIIVNEKGGISVIHSNLNLDSMTVLSFNQEKMAILKNELGDTYIVGQLKKETFRKISPKMSARMIRMNSWNVCKISELKLKFEKT